MKNRKLITALTMAACLGLLLTACSSKQEPNSNIQAEEQSGSSEEGQSKAPEGGTKESTQGSQADSGSQTAESTGAIDAQNVVTEFNKLLKEAKNVNQLYEFLDANIEKVKDDDADAMVLGLFDYVKDLTSLNQEKLDEYSNYTKPEVTDFIYMLDLELEQPSVVDGKIALTLDNLISRAGEGEFYLQQYPDSPVYQQAYDLYYKWISEAITGGFDAQTGAANQFANADGVISAEDVEYMADFSEGNDSVNGQLINEYVELLKANGNQVNDAVKAFYAELPQKVKSMY